MYTKKMLDEAHNHCHDNASEILKSEKVGCFCCGEIHDAEMCAERAKRALAHPFTYPSGLVESTVMCECMVDSLIGDASGNEITTEFLVAMNEYWFAGMGF